MVWVPQYYAVQEEALVDNVLTIIERDFKQALDVFYPIEAVLPANDPRFLADFKERAVGQILRNEFPCLAIGPNRNASTEDAGQSHLIEAVRLDIYVGVIDDSPATVTTRIMRYMGTLDAVLRTAAVKRKSDFFANMSVMVFGLTLEMEHIYGPIGSEKPTLFRGAVLQLTIQIRES